MLSPLVAVAAIGTFLAQCGMQGLLGDSASAKLFPNHPLPVNCIVMLLLFHSLYVLVVLAAASLLYLGLAVVILNWIIYVAVRV